MCQTHHAANRTKCCGRCTLVRAVTRSDVHTLFGASACWRHAPLGLTKPHVVEAAHHGRHRCARVRILQANGG